MSAAPAITEASPTTAGSEAPKTPRPARFPILYVILGVLLTISIVPMYFYSAQVEAINRDRLQTSEMLLQTTVTQSLADDLALHESSLRMMLANLSAAIEVESGGDIGDRKIETPELRALLEHFVSSSDEMDYATLLNSEAKGVSAGRIVPDAFLQRELQHAYDAARDGRAYTGQALQIEDPRGARTVVLVGSPVNYGGRFLGMVASVVDLQFLVQRLHDISGGGLTPYVVDSQGRLVASGTPQYVTGQDMKSLEIVRNFVDAGNKVRFEATMTFPVRSPQSRPGQSGVETLGTYSPVASLGWAVVVQKPTRDAYRGIYEMQRSARLLALMAVLLSVGVSIFAARKITFPLRILTQSSRALARGDFSQRVQLRSDTEIGELADTFNSMSQDLQRYVDDLKRAADENRALFLGSIQMLAGAVDEKDPYTRGHSDRVTKYSMLIGKEMNLPTDFLETLQISAQLHDVGKIGIEDHILKKPGALNAEEFEVMKTHTTKGANILRPVTQLAEMLPGIELHHEAIDGRGYPYGLQGEQIPLLARVIAVADTFDALTTNRPYQNAHTPEQALKIITNLAGKRLHPEPVEALLAVYARGEIRLQRFSIRRPVVPSSPLPTPETAAASEQPASLV